MKTTNDLLALSSDAYEVTADKRMVLKAERNGTPPDIKLDGMYKFVDQLNTLIPKGPPSLIKCDKLTVKGAVVLEAGVVFEGKVEIVGAAEGPPKVLKAGTYKDKAYEL